MPKLRRTPGVTNRISRYTAGPPSSRTPTCRRPSSGCTVQFSNGRVYILRTDQVGAVYYQDVSQSNLCEFKEKCEREIEFESEWYEKALAGLIKLRRMEDNWNGLGSPAPNDTAIEAAKRVVNLLSIIPDFQPDELTPSGSGGVALVFSGAHYADIECFNNGEIVAGLDIDGDHDIWDVEVTDAGILETAKRIRDTL